VRKVFIYVSPKNFEMAGVSRTATYRRPYLDGLFVSL
jgi:hypothetical protein